MHDPRAPLPLRSRGAGHDPRAPLPLRSGAADTVERGAATILVLSVISLLLAVTLGGLVIAGAIVASHRARLAATSRRSPALEHSSTAPRSRRPASGPTGLLPPTRLT